MCCQSVFLVFQSVWIYDGVLKLLYSLIMSGYHDIYMCIHHVMYHGCIFFKKNL
jgi:hypothetical protein